MVKLVALYKKPADRDSLNAALQSPENRAADKDLMSFAKDVVTVMFADVYESQ